MTKSNPTQLADLLHLLLGRGRRSAPSAVWGDDTRPCCPTCEYRLLRISPHWLCPNCRVRKVAIRVPNDMLEA